MQLFFGFVNVLYAEHNGVENGIALCIVMEIIGMSKKERRANVEEGIEIYLKNTRAELDEQDAKAAAKLSKKA